MYLGKQAIQIDRLNAILADSEQLPKSFDQREVIAHLVSSWDVLLHPRFAVALSALPGQFVATPDYRARFAPGLTIDAAASAQK